jgi:PhnB protein
MASQMPPEAQNSVMHSDLRNNLIHLMASDMADPNELKQGSVSLCLFSEDKEEIKALYAKLSEGATINTALKDEYFGLYADITDKFGKRWMFQGGAMAAPGQ